MRKPYIYTIGHSSHSKQFFLSMLKEAKVNAVADVRAFPASRKFPHFNQENMKKWLAGGGFSYSHHPFLAGRRNKAGHVQPEVNGAWENQSFHNYADYTLTEEFREGIVGLEALAGEKDVAYFCAERHPSRCHRLLVSNWLEANGWDVYHILDEKGRISLVKHEQGRWGAMPIIEKDGIVVYPENG
ncbi:DUF488 domain-containing protein [Salimicrobium jeotgali]|uniref:DUF488 domain-containing protein n=1 Tax=Salimicrobium jeotgali TaxID=1230341 RepID=UPI000C85612C|nr:DUF488 domain-containing protein [Salimicrobium jeotgali]